jgi:thiamine-phosphate pyrophosphorylase
MASTVGKPDWKHTGNSEEIMRQTGASEEGAGKSILARPIGRLQFLTMDNGPVDHLQQVEAACVAGIRWIQLRMKEAGDKEFLDTALAAKKICDAHACTLIINDRVEIAMAIKSHGVQLGKQDMPVDEARRMLGHDYIIGGTANTAEDVLDHYRRGADYAGLGPYRFTTTKQKLSPVLGLEGCREIMKTLREEGVYLPVIAIGGIVAEDLYGVLDAGLYGIAFSGLLVHAADKAGLVKRLNDLIITEG